MTKRKFGAFVGTMMLLAGLGSCGDTLQRVTESALSCEGACRLEFPSIDFNRAGDDDATITISNLGDGDLTITNIYLEGASPYIAFSTPTIVRLNTVAEWVAEDSDRSFNTDAGSFVVPPDNREEIELTFVPEAGAVSPECPGQPAAGLNMPCGTLVIESTDRENPEVRVPIVVSVGGSRMEVEPSRLSFSPPQLIDEAGTRYAEQRQSFTITNTGSTNLEIGSATSTNDFVVVDLPNGGLVFPYQLPPGVQQEFNAVWTPQSEEALEGTITISSDASVGQVATIFLDSEGGDASVLNIDPCSFNFPTGTIGEPSQEQFTVANDGNASMTWSMTLFNFSPPSARSEFTVLNADNLTSLGNQQPLEPGTSAEYILQHTPTSEQSITGELRISGNFGQPRICTFSAGPAQPRIEISPTEIWASDVDDEETLVRSFVVSNVGQADLEVTSIDRGAGVTDEFEVATVDTEGFTIFPGDERRIDVTYTRSADDQQVADQLPLVLQHNDANTGSGTATVRFTVRHESDLVPPVCDLAVDNEGPYSVGDTVTLDATGSEFPSGQATANPYRWNIVTPMGSGTRFDEEFATTPTLSFDVAGTYEVGVVVSAVYGEGEITQCELLRTFDVN